MNEGDILLTPIAQADGRLKNRPALFLRELPPFRDILACGISTQIHQAVEGFDELIQKNDSDYSRSGLVADSIIRLGFLAVIPRKNIIGSIGAISPVRHARLLKKLSTYLEKGIKTL